MLIVIDIFVSFRFALFYFFSFCNVVLPLAKRSTSSSSPSLVNRITSLQHSSFLLTRANGASFLQARRGDVFLKMLHRGPGQGSDVVTSSTVRDGTAFYKNIPFFPALFVRASRLLARFFVPAPVGRLMHGSTTRVVVLRDRSFFVHYVGDVLNFAFTIARGGWHEKERGRGMWLEDDVF